MIKRQAEELRNIFRTGPTVENLFHPSLEGELKTRAVDPDYEEFQMHVQKTVERLYGEARPLLEEMERQFEWSHRFPRELQLVYQTSQQFPPIRVEVFTRTFIAPDFPMYVFLSSFVDSPRQPQCLDDQPEIKVLTQERIELQVGSQHFELRFLCQGR